MSLTFLGYFFETICNQELVKIVQSGHTGHDLHLMMSSFACSNIIFESFVLAEK